MSQSHRAAARINTLPNEIFEKIIREYSTVSINLSRNSPITFMAVCPMWRIMGQNFRESFRPYRLVVSGHDELQQLLVLIRRGMIPRHIESLCVNLAPTFTDAELRQSGGLQAAMRQIQQDIDDLRVYVIIDWRRSHPWLRVGWQTLEIRQFSLYVSLSGILAQEEMLKAWIRVWVVRGGREWIARGWTGEDGFSGRGFYSHWDQ